MKFRLRYSLKHVFFAVVVIGILLGIFINNRRHFERLDNLRKFPILVLPSGYSISDAPNQRIRWNLDQHSTPAIAILLECYAGWSVPSAVSQAELEKFYGKVPSTASNEYLVRRMLIGYEKRHSIFGPRYEWNADDFKNIEWRFRPLDAKLLSNALDACLRIDSLKTLVVSDDWVTNELLQRIETEKSVIRVVIVSTKTKKQLENEISFLNDVSYSVDVFSSENWLD